MVSWPFSVTAVAGQRGGTPLPGMLFSCSLPGLLVGVRSSFWEGPLGSCKPVRSPVSSLFYVEIKVPKVGISNGFVGPNLEQ